MIDIERLARDAGLGRGTSGRWLATDDELQAFAALVIAEAAKVCEELPMQQETDVRDQCAAVLRALKGKP
jgi:hypothetical protein